MILSLAIIIISYFAIGATMCIMVIAKKKRKNMPVEHAMLCIMVITIMWGPLYLYLCIDEMKIKRAIGKGESNQ